METEFDPPVIIEPRGGPIFRFTTLEELAEWATKEASYWSSWHRQLPRPFDQWLTEIAQYPLNLHQQIDQYRKTKPPQQNNALEQIRNISANYHSGPAIYSESLPGRHLEEIRSGKGELRAVLEAGLIVNNRQIKFNELQNQAINIEEVWAVVAKKIGLGPNDDGNSPTQLDTLSNIVGEYQKRFDHMISEFGFIFQNQISSVKSFLSDVEEDRNKINNRVSFIEARRIALWKNIKESIRSAREEQKSLLQTYETFLALDAPAGYWKERAKENRWTAAFAFAVFVVSFLGLGGVVYYNWPSLKLALSNDKGVIELGTAILIAPIIISAMWLLRMISKVFLTGLTEAVDADQREVMVKTFLALTKDPNTKMADAERLMILQALFRSSGAKGDDEMPTNFLEAALKAAQGGKP